MHYVGLDVVKQTLVVGYDYGRCLLGAQFVEACGYDAQGVNVKTGVGLVEYAEGRLQHCHLEYLIALLLATREALVDRTAHQLLVYLHQLTLLLHQLDEVSGLHRLQSLCLATGVDGSLHKVGH